jgi:shikimate kinase
MIVTLIGSRGCGKSSVGRLLANRLGWDFADADAELENRAGKSIQQIFADDGETAFRDLEEQAVADLLQRDRLVLAAGGGAVLREATRERIASAGPAVWLTASPETLYARIHADDTTADRRPDLTDRGGLEEVRTLLAQREPVYRDTANIVADTEHKTVEQIAGEIHEQLLQREEFAR